MKEKSAENNGKYVAVHLRFEEVSFSPNIDPQFVPQTTKHLKSVKKPPGCFRCC
jgi:hypothetical protein